MNTDDNYYKNNVEKEHHEGSNPAADGHRERKPINLPVKRRNLLRVAAGSGAATVFGGTPTHRNIVAASPNDKLEITPTNVGIAPGGSYLVVLLIPDRGTVEDITVSLKVSSNATLTDASTTSGESGLTDDDRTDTSFDEVEYQSENLSTGETIFVQLEVPGSTSVGGDVTVTAEYEAIDPGIIFDDKLEYSATESYTLTDATTTFESLARQAENRAKISEKYAEVYQSIISNDDFDTILVRTLTDSFAVIGAEVVKSKLIGPFEAVSTASDAIEAYETTLGDGGTTKTISGLLSPVIAELSDFRSLRLNKVADEDDTGTSLEMLAQYQREEASAWRNGDRDAAMDAIDKQETAICVDDDTNANIYDVDRSQNPCVFRAANKQWNSHWITGKDYKNVREFFSVVMDYAREEQEHLNSQLRPQTNQPDPSVESTEAKLSNLRVGERTTIDFSVSNSSSGGFSDRGYLSISHSSSLSIKSVEQTAGDSEESFDQYDIEPGESFFTPDGEGTAEVVG